ncbi:GNAT family N-acetyltransferase [Cohnella caldifontis]|uniref:GNAT family N-acetyltransferase n=1 Tax=Cohnella caldifontis TaxID=3027471 RepID=UPI0023EADDB4|nr:GNAT family N-acetyltransferase [Cohnella sp. YIM B05605]
MPLIRWRQRGDEEAIFRLVKTELVPLSSRPGMRDGRLRREIAERLRRGMTFVASRSAGSEPFAFVHMELHRNILFIDLLAVDSAEQNHRWGTRLMAEAERFGLSRGCREARLFVDDTNVRGLRFYTKLGYAGVRHIPSAKCYELAKPLAAPTAMTWAF